MRDIAFSLYVYSPQLERVGEVRGVKSLQWLSLYQDVGEAKLVCGTTGANLELLKNGNLLQNTDDPKQLALIQSVEIDDKAKSASVTVRAVFTSCRLAQRVVMYTERYTDAERGMLDIVSHNLRGLPMIVGGGRGLAAPLNGQVSWGSVLDAVTDIAVTSGLGFRTVFDAAALSETFEVYRGADRTLPGSEAYVGFFGDDARNIASIEIKNDDSQIKNVAIVCGEGEGAARVVVEVDLSGGGERRELYVDARNLTKKSSSPKEDGSVENVELTDEEYHDVLYARGVSALAETSGGLELGVEIAQTVLLLGKDYELGDILPLRVRKYGVCANVRVSQVKRIYETSNKIEAVLEVLP